MEVYNQEKTRILSEDEYDSTKGRFADDTITIHHDEVKAVERQVHYEVVKEYPNGGREVKEIVDVEGVEPKDAYDEKKKVTVFIPYTEEELEAMRKEQAILNRKSELEETDYAIIKFMDSYIKGNPALLAEFEKEYKGLLEKREEARAEINALE